MPSVLEMVQSHSPQKDIVPLKHHKIRYYSEEDVAMLLEVLAGKDKVLGPLKKQVTQFEARSAEYLEIYQVMNKRHEDLVRRNAFLRERHDLPVDRIPAYIRAEYIRNQQIGLIQKQIANVADLARRLLAIRNAAYPDPNDERDISLTWLIKIIMKHT